ncbi:MAG: ion channel [Cyclobacteriaceae bacterium]|nr:ion channel [Cyclobacteriaceae bacterium]MDH4298004.1 ion channel [Cyclobacteriaceae bacterium]MDH5251174.1 ion channel [Cyclobacteriaceae bacterium]
MHTLLKQNHDFWNHERSLKALLVYMSISLFVWIPIAGAAHTWWGFLISEVLFNLIILAGVFSVLTRWKKQLFFIANAVLASVFRIFSFFIVVRWVELVGYVFGIVFLMLLGRMVLQHIFKDGPVNFYRIQGSIVVFMIIGIVWAMLYTLIESLLPGSFSATHGSQVYDDLFSQFLYFSFVTMTTLGFGDMIPTGSLAKSLVIFEGMIGLLYPVIMIARLVTLEVTHSAQEKK